MRHNEIVAYVRVSTEEQVQEGTSLQVQEDRIRSYAAAVGIPYITRVVVDAGFSAKDVAHRPGLQGLLCDVQLNKIGTIIVLKLDRLTRSVKDLGALVDDFTRHCVKLVSVTENLDTTSASGRMFINMIGVFSQWERETIAERTTTALAHRRENGRVYGAVPYGWRRDCGDLVVDRQAQAIVTDMSKLRTMGTSYREIAIYLNKQGVQTPRGGKKWTSSSVYSVLNPQMQTA